MSKISYSGYRFPPEIIQQAVWLYLRFTLSFRHVEDWLAERRILVSYETVRRWVNHFGPKIAADLRKRRSKPGFCRRMAMVRAAMVNSACPAINNAQGASCTRAQTRHHHVPHAETRRRVRAGVAPPPPERPEAETSSQGEHDPKEGAKDGADSVARPDHERPVRFQPSRRAPS